jgi:hypothetical protein
MATLATAAAAWTREEDKAFENAVAAAAAPPDDGPPDDGWFTALVASVPARTAEEVRRHYEALVEDVAAIEAGRIPLPRYAGEESSAATPEGSGSAASAPKDAGGGGGGGGGHRREERKSGVGVDVGKSSSKAEQERRKGIPWTEEEHRFLADLHVFSPSKAYTFLVGAGCSCWVWTSSARATGGASRATSSSHGRRRRWRATRRNTSSVSTP